VPSQRKFPDHWLKLKLTLLKAVSEKSETDSRLGEAKSCDCNTRPQVSVLSVNENNLASRTFKLLSILNSVPEGEKI